MLKDWSIKPKANTIKNPQANSPVERIHQVLRHMLLTKNPKEKTFDYIDPFGATLVPVASKNQKSRAVLKNFTSH